MSWKTIGATSGYVMAGTIATQLLQWVIMASIAHLGGPQTLGFFALAQAFALPIQYLSWLSIRQRYLTLRDGDENLSDLVFLRITVPALAFTIAQCFIIAFGQPELIYISALLFLFKYIEGFYDLIYAIMQKGGDAKLLARLAIVRSIVSGSIFVLIYYVTRNLYVAMLATALQQAVLLLWVKGYLRADTEIYGGTADRRASLRRRYYLGAELLPVSLSLVVMSLNASIPRFLLNGIIGAKELGYFAAVSSFISLGAIATGSLGQSLLQPLAASIEAHAERSFWRQLLWPILLMNLSAVVAAVVAFLVGSQVLELIYGSAFKDLHLLLVAGALASGPVYAASIATNGIFAAYLRNALFWSQIATVAFTTVGTFILVPYLHIQGTFVIMGLSGLFQVLLCISILRRFWAGYSDSPRHVHAVI